MPRDKLMNLHGIEKDFRWRSLEITRIEALSDAVFAFAVTLLIVALEVPRTFHELKEVMIGFPAFAVAFALLFHIWHMQYVFFRRYGLQDGVTLLLNGILLFVVLFFVYPLKFLFGLLLRMVLHLDIMQRTHSGELEPMVRGSEVPTLMVIYGLGYIAIHCVFWLLYWHAYRKRSELELNPRETRRTLRAMQHYTVDVGVAVTSVLLALLLKPELAGIAGFTYMVLAPLHMVMGNVQDRREKREL